MKWCGCVVCRVFFELRGVPPALDTGTNAELVTR